MKFKKWYEVAKAQQDSAVKTGAALGTRLEKTVKYDSALKTDVATGTRLAETAQQDLAKKTLELT